MGRQKRCEYMLNMASMPMVTVPERTPKPPRQMTRAMAIDGEDFDRRVVERVGKDGVFEGDHVEAVDGFEIVVGALFAVEKLDDGHAADVFLGEAVDAGDGGADAAVAFADAVAEQARDEQDERQDGEGQQREPPVDAEHHDGHDGEREEVVDDGEDAAGEHFIDGVDVGGDAGDQAAHGVGVEEADVHALHVAEDVAAQVEHDLLSGPLHQVGLDEFEEIGGDGATEVDGGKPGDAVHGSAERRLVGQCGGGRRRLSVGSSGRCRP